MTDAATKKNATLMSIMMFLQFFVWGAWFTTLGLCLNVNGMGSIIGNAYGTAPIAAIIAPLFLGLIADRFFPSQIVMGVLMLLGGVFMCMTPGLIEAGNAGLVSKLFLGRVFDVDQTANFCLEYGCHMTFEKIGTSAVPYMYLPTP